MAQDFWRSSEIERYYSREVTANEESKDTSKDKYEYLMKVDKVGSEGGTLYVYRHRDTNDIHIRRGCFSGSLEEFEERVKRKPFGDRHREIYEQLIEVIKRNYVEKPKGTIRHTELSRGNSHVNYCCVTGKILFSSSQETNHYKTRFTWEEANDVAKTLGIKIVKAGYTCTEDTKLVWEEAKKEVFKL